ncbi:MAG: glucose-1-phosphate adenylyltransferase subunit GlgD [Eubacteriales bacterium]|nr:glucose-1-phosphate adenylyltransferase subunit GlgD [Clostridiales bacterium]MDD7300762.1 glucose-1-phosphate adenylyltransferase subunit GlgD [Eubacteriales bacterium]MDY4435708.1 glucose-1-phosphate adenylyltransferase subunit GlgD [Candidatus Flemingibacterium sp.]
MSVQGIIFSNLHDKNIPELTLRRTMASVPYAGRYRLIDFALSNMVNSGITSVSVITHYNYQSLMDHIGAGKDWDLARRSGGIKILPPYMTAYANQSNALYNSRMEALKSVNYSVSRFTSDYVVLSDCDVICNVDLNDMINDHIENNADITIAVKRVLLNKDSASRNVIIDADPEGRIVDINPYPTNVTGYRDIDLNILVINRDYLQSIVVDAIAHGYTSFNRDVIARNTARRNFRIYKYDGYFANIGSLADYYSHSMELLGTPENRDEIFGIKTRPIYTKVRNSAPTRYAESSVVKNSLVADGCIIDGTVENSIIFRGVKISRGATVKNSILFQDTVIGENVFLNCVITDKNVVIRDGRILSGHETLPFFVEKNRLV